jgi:hypothetical protein
VVVAAHSPVQFDSLASELLGVWEAALVVSHSGEPMKQACFVERRIGILAGDGQGLLMNALGVVVTASGNQHMLQDFQGMEESVASNAAPIIDFKRRVQLSLRFGVLPMAV